MSTYYLINTVTVGSQKYFAGRYCDSTVDPTTDIAAAGGVLWISSDATVAAAAAICATRHTSRGANEAELDSLMFASVHASLTAQVTANLATAALPASATIPGLQSVAQFNQVAAESPAYRARYVAFANVADRSAFVVSQDGVTGVAGDVVLLANQTTAAECGLYRLGTVAGTAPLTRIAALPIGASYINGCTVEVSEGTIFAGSTWKSMATGAKVVATDDPLFYPRICKGILTLASGTKTLGSAEGLFVFSATKSNFQASMDTPGGTLTLTVGGYGFNAAGISAGKSGTAAAICIARVAAGTIDTANNSTVAWQCVNW